MYTNDQIVKFATNAQCCLATLSTQLLFAEMAFQPNRLKLKKDFLILTEIIKILNSYKPIGYVYTENSYVETADDQCLTDEDMVYIIQEFKNICSCASCLDAEDLLKDI